MSADMADPDQEVPRWVVALLAVLFFLPLGLIMFFGGVLVLFTLPAKHAPMLAVFSVLSIVVAILLCGLTLQLIRGKKSKQDSLLSPTLLRILSGVFLAVPLIALVLSLAAGALEVTPFLMSLLAMWSLGIGCLRLARKRSP